MSSSGASCFVMVLCFALCNGHKNASSESLRETCLREVITSLSSCFYREGGKDILHVGYSNSKEYILDKQADGPEPDNSPASIRKRWYDYPTRLPNLSQYCDVTSGNATYRTYNDMKRCVSSLPNGTGECDDVYEDIISFRQEVYDDLCSDPAKYIRLGQCYYGRGGMDYPNKFQNMTDVLGVPEMYEKCMSVTSQRGRIQRECENLVKDFDNSVVPLFGVNPLCEEYTSLLEKRSSAVPLLSRAALLMFAVLGALTRIFVQE